MSEDVFGRVITAMVTPFKEDGGVDREVAGKLAARLASEGSDGLVVCGTTGESPTLTREEERDLFQVVKKAVPPGVKIIAGTGSNSTEEAIAATREAARLGVDGSLQVVPYYNKPPQEGLYRHFEAIARACPDLPVMLYNVPGRSGQSLQPETIARLAAIENIVAIKEASGSLDRVCQIQRLSSPPLAIYSGEDHLTLPLLSVGGKGVVSVASHLVGPRLQQMIRDFEAGKVEAARAAHLELYPLFKGLFATTNPIPIKAALEMLGWRVGPPRSPLIELPLDLQEQLKIVLKDLSLI